SNRKKRIYAKKKRRQSRRRRVNHQSKLSEPIVLDEHESVAPSYDVLYMIVEHVQKDELVWLRRVSRDMRSVVDRIATKRGYTKLSKTMGGALRNKLRIMEYIEERLVPYGSWKGPQWLWLIYAICRDRQWETLQWM